MTRGLARELRRPRYLPVTAVLWVLESLRPCAVREGAAAMEGINAAALDKDGTVTAHVETRYLMACKDPVGFAGGEI